MANEKKLAGAARQTFNIEGDVARIKKQLEDARRFRTEETRNAAAAADEDAEAARQRALKDFKETTDRNNRSLKNVDFTKPQEAEFAKHINKLLFGPKQDYEKELRRIDRKLDFVRMDIEMTQLDLKRHIGPYGPERQISFVPHPTDRFNDSAREGMPDKPEHFKQAAREDYHPTTFNAVAGVEQKHRVKPKL